MYPVSRRLLSIVGALLLLSATNSCASSGAPATSENTVPAGDSREAADPADGSGGEASEASLPVEPLEDSDIIPVGDSPVRGAADAPVTIVMFTDMQCPFCERGAQTMEALLERHPDDVRVVFKHFPLPFHTEAKMASKAALTARDMRGDEAFWQVHDLLFANMKSMKDYPEESAFTTWVSNLWRERLDQETPEDPDKGAFGEIFRSNLRQNSDAYDAVIARDMALGEALGVRGTPHFFVNGARVTGAQPLEFFERGVEVMLERAAQLEQEGVARSALYKTMVQANYEPPAAPEVPEAQPPKPEVVDQELLSLGDAPVKGPDDAPVTVVIFSDFECPFSQRGDANLRAAMQKFDGQVKVAFKHFPVSFRRNARPAAKAAMAAGEQGKFWEMHDHLFANQGALGEPGFFVDSARKLGLDVAAFEAAMSRPAYDQQIDADMAQGQEAGVRGTPAIFVNGRVVMGAQPPEVFEATIEAALEAQDQ